MLTADGANLGARNELELAPFDASSSIHFGKGGEDARSYILAKSPCGPREGRGLAKNDLVAAYPRFGKGHDGNGREADPNATGEAYATKSHDGQRPQKKGDRPEIEVDVKHGAVLEIH